MSAMSITRRDILTRGAAGTGLIVVGTATGGLSLAPVAHASSTLRTPPVKGRIARPAAHRPMATDPNGLLDLPEGFSYTIVSKTGDPLADGTSVGDAFDGTAVFEGAEPGRAVLVRNHELSGDDSPLEAAAELVYDPAGFGGTTTIVVDSATGARLDEWVSLAGTMTNCAGGPTPWGTWLSCEETEAKAGEDDLEKDHGFVFEVDPLNQDNNRNPVPLRGLGRFPHEAVAIDPETGVVYLTEDASEPNGLLYRATPSTPLGGHGSLRDGATLEALAATKDGVPVPDLSIFSDRGDSIDLAWVEIPDPLAATESTRAQVADVTRSRKLEGIWWGEGSAYVVASYARTDDGSAAEHDGQVWKLDPVANTMSLVVHFPVNDHMTLDAPDGPDNITVAPWGGLILAEDGEGSQHLISVTPDGTFQALARNARDDGEFAGPCFYDDTLYVNLQRPGVTFAIKGPFEGLR